MVQHIRKTVAAAGQSGVREAQRRETKGASFREALSKATKGERGIASPLRQAQELAMTARGRNVSGSTVTDDARRTMGPRLEKITLTQAARLAHFSPIIRHCAAKYQVPVSLICGVMLQESGGNPNACSPAGARGLMQLMPATARRMGVREIMDPRQNIEGGVRYLRFLLDRFRGNVKLAVAGYNCGEGNIEKYGHRIPPFAETQGYVPRVLAFARTVHYILGGGGSPSITTAAPVVPSGSRLASRLIKLT